MTKLAVLLLATTGLSGCANEELDRCIEKEDMKYQACLTSKESYMHGFCTLDLEFGEERCERKHGKK